MSHSRKKAIIKDKPRNYKRTTLYWRRVRKNWQNLIRSINISQDNDIVFPHQKSIVNDYDYCDYIADYEFTPWIRRREYQKEEREINRRK